MQKRLLIVYVSVILIISAIGFTNAQLSQLPVFLSAEKNETIDINTQANFRLIL